MRNLDFSRLSTLSKLLVGSVVGLFLTTTMVSVALSDGLNTFTKYSVFILISYELRRLVKAIFG